MPHARQTIRAAIAAQVTGLATTGINVFEQRVYPAEQAVLPALVIYGEGEESEPETMSYPRNLARTWTVNIVGLAKATANLEDVLDDIALEIENAIGADPTLGGVARTMTLVGTDQKMEAVGEQPAGLVALSYEVLYRTAETDAAALT